MGRTGLLRQLSRIMRFSIQAAQTQVSESQAIEAWEQKQYQFNRREFIKNSAGFLAAGTTLSGFSARAFSRDPNLMPRFPGFHEPVVVVGAGLAGLTTAYRLMQKRIPCVVYEALPTQQFGGRIQTHYNFNEDQMFCELGAELVDTKHLALRSLCEELGVGVQKIKQNNSDLPHEIFFFNNQYYTEKDVVRSFLPLGRELLRDIERLKIAGAVHVPTFDKPLGVQDLDNTSLKDYLEKFRDKSEDWLRELIRLAYVGEYGLEAEQQSALNLLILVGADSTNEFKLFGDSDQANRIQFGSSQLIKALIAALEKGGVKICDQHILRQIKRGLNQLVLTFDTPAGTQEVRSNQTVMTVPFSVLRSVEGIESLGLNPLTTKSINTLGYGKNSKLMLGFTEKIWRMHSPLWTANEGAVVTDLPSQSFWETSRQQKGTSGILTNFFGGSRAEQPPKDLLASALEDLNRIYPGIAQSFDGNVKFRDWGRQKFQQGSYSCPLVGQYTSIIGVTRIPQLGGQLYFAGEHCSVDYGGFMNGAVESANTVAEQVILPASMQRAVGGSSW